MSRNFWEISHPAETDLVVSFFDLTGFARFARNTGNQELTEFIAAYYEFVGDIIESKNGKVVKFIGDSGLIAFPESAADQAVISLLELQKKGDRFLLEHKANCRHIIKAHFGKVVCAIVGTQNEKRFDIFGETVNIAAMLESNGCAITPQLFRKLLPETRKYFKKHTPPITYIGIEEHHR